MRPEDRPTVFRWLQVGQRYVYRPALGRGDDARRGQACTVLIVPGYGGRGRNALVEFDDGHRFVAPTGVVRRA